jgi:hypothetical protein
MAGWIEGHDIEAANRTIGSAAGSSRRKTLTNGFISLAAISGILVDHFLFLG